ncbi:uncharacterized protein LOC131892905 [Tigriopus californicus]|uniref:uncharacterized protein LOC131892905 n=1 Tax=Tigriopus californicus TaxID=6832 RepID=UPI0027DA0821|nr:uncharacterized protein LOC131892905 [Tigriopus californicus]
MFVPTLIILSALANLTASQIKGVPIRDILKPQNDEEEAIGTSRPKDGYRDSKLFESKDDDKRFNRKDENRDSNHKDEDREFERKDQDRDFNRKEQHRDFDNTTERQTKRGSKSQLPGCKVPKWVSSRFPSRTATFVRPNQILNLGPCRQAFCRVIGVSMELAIQEHCCEFRHHHLNGSTAILKVGETKEVWRSGCQVRYATCQDYLNPPHVNTRLVTEQKNDGCCYSQGRWIMPGDHAFIPEKCSKLICIRHGASAKLIFDSVYDQTDCCEFQDRLVQPGWQISSPFSRGNITCYNGSLVDMSNVKQCSRVALDQICQEQKCAQDSALRELLKVQKHLFYQNEGHRSFPRWGPAPKYASAITLLVPNTGSGKYMENFLDTLIRPMEQFPTTTITYNEKNAWYLDSELLVKSRPNKANNGFEFGSQGVNEYHHRERVEKISTERHLDVAISSVLDAYHAESRDHSIFHYRSPWVVLVIDSKWDESVTLQIFERLSTIIIDLNGGNSFLREKCAKDALGNSLYFTADRVRLHQILGYVAKWNQCESPHNTYPHVYSTNDQRIPAQNKFSIMPPYFRFSHRNKPCWATWFHVDQNNYVVKKRLPCERLRKITETQGRPRVFQTIRSKTISDPTGDHEETVDPLLNDMPLSSNPDVKDFLEDSKENTEQMATETPEPVEPVLNPADLQPEVAEEEQNNEDAYNDYLS